MDNKIIIIIKEKIKEINKKYDAEILRNIAKEEIQYYILNFIYHHAEYSKWTMYGGSVLRICHGLDRMSVDLDFEIKDKCTEVFLNKIKNELEQYFLENYNLDDQILKIKIVNNRGLLLKFLIGSKLGIKHPSDQIHVKIDLNTFVSENTTIETIPIIYNQMSFVVKTYNMSNLMASKITAILSRGERIVGKDKFLEKGRDIYDLVWYMNNKITPDIDYINEKNVLVSDIKILFDKITTQVNKVSDRNLKQDLTPLFLDQNYINNWLLNWKDHYYKLLESYNIRNVLDLESILIKENIKSDDFLFSFVYNTKDDIKFKIEYNITWEVFNLIKIDKKSFEVSDIVLKLIKDKKYSIFATIFYNKNIEYFKKTNNYIIGNILKTKRIRITADNLNRRQEIVLNSKNLISCDLESLIK